MTTPFRALEPFQARIVDLFYEANVGACLDVTDHSDASDTSSDFSDVTDGGELII